MLGNLVIIELLLLIYSHFVASILAKRRWFSFCLSEQCASVRILTLITSPALAIINTLIEVVFIRPLLTSLSASRFLPASKIMRQGWDDNAWMFFCRLANDRWKECSSSAGKGAIIEAIRTWSLNPSLSLLFRYSFSMVCWLIRAMFLPAAEHPLPEKVSTIHREHHWGHLLQVDTAAAFYG